MTRSRTSARAAGTRFETLVADWLAATWDDRIERRARTGAKDRGDIAGLRFAGRRVVVECKDHNRLDLAGWWAEAETERGNDDAVAALVVHKRRGRGKASDQWVTLTLGDLVALLGGPRDGAA
jgi:hypothetical protein